MAPKNIHNYNFDFIINSMNLLREYPLYRTMELSDFSEVDKVFFDSILARTTSFFYFRNYYGVKNNDGLRQYMSIQDIMVSQGNVDKPMIKSLSMLLKRDIQDISYEMIKNMNKFVDMSCNNS